MLTYREQVSVHTVLAAQEGSSAPLAGAVSAQLFPHFVGLTLTDPSEDHPTFILASVQVN